MSAYTTLAVTKEDAKKAIIMKLMNDEIDERELERMMDALYDERLFNFRFVPWYTEEELNGTTPSFRSERLMP